MQKRQVSELHRAAVDAEQAAAHAEALRAAAELAASDAAADAATARAAAAAERVEAQRAADDALFGPEAPRTGGGREAAVFKLELRLGEAKKLIARLRVDNDTVADKVL